VSGITERTKVITGEGRLRSPADLVREGALYQSREHEGWRDAMRRAENVRRRGVFAVIERTDPGRYDYASRRTGPDTYTLRWHADQECPDVMGAPRWDGREYAHNSHGPDGARWSAHAMASVLAGVTDYGGSLPVCARCVLLEVPAAELADGVMTGGTRQGTAHGRCLAAAIRPLQRLEMRA
jgi:hypothetical protein